MLLEEGMVIYEENLLPTALHKYTVSRVTKTQAIISHGHYETRFDRDVGTLGCFYAKGSSTYSRSCYKVATPELDEKYYRQGLLKAINKIDLTELSTKQLERIYAIAKEETA